VLDKLKQPIAIFLFALAIRGVVCYWNFAQFSADPDAYARIAATLAETGVYGLTGLDNQPKPTAFRPPLYPYLLAKLVSDGQVSPWAVACLHTVLGAITVLCTFLIYRRLVGQPAGERFALLAALLVTVDPILVQQSSFVMTETLATALASVVIWAWIRCGDSECARSRGSVGCAVGLGLLLALAYLCRPTFLVWAVLLGGAMLLRPAIAWKRRFTWAALVLLPIAIALFLWTERNRHAVGHPVWATTHGGYTLLLANNPSFYDYLQQGGWGEAWDAQPFLRAYEHRYDGDPNTEAFWLTGWSNEQTHDPRTAKEEISSAEPDRNITEYEDDRVCYLAARATIEREPRTFVWSCLVRLARLWSPLPHHTPGRSWLKVIAIGIYYSLFYVAVLLGMRRIGRSLLTSPWWAVWTLAIALSLVHAVYWSNLRMRAPIIPALAVIAAAGLAPRRDNPNEHPKTDE
jgi:hypothetical protein